MLAKFKCLDQKLVNERAPKSMDR